MSYILDALKKSERQRHLGKAPVYGDAGAGKSPAFFRWASLAAGLLLVAALLLTVLLPWRRAPVAPPPAEPAATATVMPTPPAVRPAPVAVTTPDTAPPAAEPIAAERPTPEEIKQPVKAAKPASPAAPPSPPAPGGDAPWLVSLPESFRRGLPPLMVNIHVYAPDEAQRILYINNRPVRRGEQVEGGVVVEDIVPEGVVLQYRGQRFKLPRPS
jgi:general secretion pathway protein B